MNKIEKCLAKKITQSGYDTRYIVEDRPKYGYCMYSVYGKLRRVHSVTTEKDGYGYHIVGVKYSTVETTGETAT